MASKKFLFLVAGVMLLILGVIMYVVEAGLGLYSGGSFALAAVCVIAWAAANWKELRLMLSGRAARYGAASLLFIIAFVGILVMVALYSRKHHHRWDLTESKSHSLALQSRQLLDRLDSDTLELTAYVFYRGENDLRSRQPLVDLLDTYRYYSDNFTYELVDIDRNPLLAMQLGITSTSAMILQYGEEQEKIYSDQEAKITSALAGLLGGPSPGGQGLVYFTTGHGEPPLEQGETIDFSSAKTAIEDQLGPVRELLLATGKPVPDSCEVLVVAGPEKNLLPRELESIRSYIAGGGRVLFLLEPFMADSLTVFLEPYGVEAGNDIVIDLLNSAVASPFTFLVDDYPEHEITRFFDVGTVFDMVRSVRPDSTPSPGVEAETILRTSERSWAENDLESLQQSFDQVARKALDEGEPVPIGVAATLRGTESAGEPDSLGVADEPGSARIVVIGDRDFATSALIGQLGNRDLLLNCLRWLRGQADEITIAPKETEDTPLVLERSEMITMALVCVVALPVGIILTGLFVWIRRRRSRR